jgi:hypothetical protein
MTTPCTRDQEIAVLYKTLITGNGRPPITDQLTELNTNLKTYMKRQDDLITEFGITSREFYDFREKVVTTDRVREAEKGERQTKNRWIIGLIVVASIGLLGFISAWTLDARKEARDAKTIATDLIPRNPRSVTETTPINVKADSTINQLNKK